MAEQLRTTYRKGGLLAENSQINQALKQTKIDCDAIEFTKRSRCSARQLYCCMSNNGNSLELKIVVMTFNIWHMVNAQPCWNKTEKHARRLLADSWRSINLYGRLTFDTYKCITKKCRQIIMFPFTKSSSGNIVDFRVNTPVSIFKCVYN